MPSCSANRGMKAFGDASQKRTEMPASSFSLTEKLVLQEKDLDESNLTGILTSSFLPPSCLPSQILASGYQKFVACYSGATVPDFHGVPRTSNYFELTITKNCTSVTLGEANCQEVFLKTFSLTKISTAYGVIQTLLLLLVALSIETIHPRFLKWQLNLAKID